MQVNRWWGLLSTLFVAFLFDFCFIRGHKCPDYLLLLIKMINQICLFSAYQQEAPKKIAFHFKITFYYHSARDSFTIFPFAFLFSCFLFSTIDKTIKLWFMATNYISKTEPQRGVLQIDWRHIFISLYSVLCFDDCWF